MDNSTPFPPVILITGFLGSGKTTFLRQLLHTSILGNRNAVIVNDFGTEVFDGALLRDTSTFVLDVPGGCLCCSACEHFHTALEEILPQNPERIFIEATGLADPIQVRYDMAVLGIPITMTLCVVDVQNFPAEQRLMTTARHQVQTSNIILLSRDDCATPMEHEATLALIAELNPRAPILRLNHGKLSAEHRALLFAEQHAFDEHFNPLQEHLLQDNITAFKITLTEPLTLDVAHALMAALPPQVLRCKGRIYTPSPFDSSTTEEYIANYVCGAWDFTPIVRAQEKSLTASSFFAIGHALTYDTLTACLQQAVALHHTGGTIRIKEGRVRSIGVPQEIGVPHE